MKILPVVLIIILGFIVYINSLNGKFVWDDHHLVKDNIYIKDWSNIPKIFTEDISAGSSNKFYYYRPIQMLFYMMDYSLWKLNVAGYHITNTVLHILTALCIFRLVNMLFQDKLLSFFSSLFFLVHPLHTESVAYISGRADILVALFMLLSFIFYIKYIQKENLIVYILALVNFILALLSRENALILPVLFLLYHYTFKKNIKIKGFMPILFIVFIYIFLRFTILKPLLPNIIGQTSIFQRVPGFFVAITNYTRLLLLPFSLHMEYEDRLFNLMHPGTFLGMFILFGLLIYAFKKIKTNRLIPFSIFWFFATLLPLSNIFIPLSAYMSLHWLYVPSIGFSIVLGNLLNPKRFKIMRLGLAIIFIIYYSSLTIRQNSFWKDPFALYKRTVDYAPYSYAAHTLLGIEYKNMGKNEEAVKLYKKAISLNPHYAEPYVNLGFLYAESDREEEAVLLYKRAIENNPNYPESYNNLGIIYNKLGKKEEAVSLYKKAIEIGPNYAKAYNNLGIAYHELGRIDEAIELFRKTIEIEPAFPDAYNNLAVILYNIGKKEEALLLFNKALQISPDHIETRNNLEKIKATEDTEKH